MTIKMKQFAVILLVLISYTGVAQKVLSIDYFQQPLPGNAFRNHTQIQPARVQPQITDTGIVEILVAENKAFRLFPLSESYATYDSAFNYRASLGVGLTYEKNKWYNRTQVLSGWSSRETVDQEHPVFLPQHNRPYYWFNDVRTRTHYTPSKNLDVSFGIDNHFLGEGYRSLIMSNQNAPVPFAMMRVNFWKLEYGLLYQAYHENDTSGLLWKYNVQHYLSWNATKRFNVTLFEQVFFQPKDGPFMRGFEVEYLNPIVFFRPQEYSLGSSDNVILGLQTSYKLKNHTIYGQVVLDEFVLDEIKNRTRWWANKYGAQLGVKGKVNNLNYLVEGSFMRPYTFSHINIGQNGGNLGLAAGHPLGSNFAEILTTVSYKTCLRKTDEGEQFIVLKGIAAFQLKGYDADSLSWGGNIYESYVLRPKEYGSTIGQGITVRSIIVGVQSSYTMKAFPLEYYAQLTGNYSWGEVASSFKPMVVVGIRSSLFQSRKLL